jgi:DNA-directed RNA polymerase specialized sigma54-like protein
MNKPNRAANSEARTQFATLPDDVRENLKAAVYSHELSAILNCIAQAVRESVDDNGYDEDAKAIQDDARIVFHAAAHVSN